jgi:hypothetical protein
LPLNFETPARVHVGESGNWSFLSFDLAIASDSGQMASRNHNDTRKQNDQDLSHVKYAFSVMMRRRRVLDSTKT